MILGFSNPIFFKFSVYKKSLNSLKENFSSPIFFITYQYLKEQFADSNGEVSALNIGIASFLAGLPGNFQLVLFGKFQDDFWEYHKLLPINYGP